MEAEITAPVETAAVPPVGRRRRRRYSQLSRGDKITLWLMAGIPTLVHVVFVWVPAFMTISLSFTKWDGLKLGSWQLIGFRNYWAIFTVFDGKFFPALFNNVLLLVFLSLCSIVGVLFALPPLRDSLPGRPPPGTIFDFVSFYWSVTIIGVNLMLVLAIWLRRTRAQTRLRDLDDATVPAGPPTGP